MYIMSNQYTYYVFLHHKTKLERFYHAEIHKRGNMQQAAWNGQSTSLAVPKAVNGQVIRQPQCLRQCDRACGLGRCPRGSRSSGLGRGGRSTHRQAPQGVRRAETPRHISSTRPAAVVCARGSQGQDKGYILVTGHPAGLGCVQDEVRAEMDSRAPSTGLRTGRGRVGSDGLPGATRQPSRKPRVSHHSRAARARHARHTHAAAERQQAGDAAGRGSSRQVRKGCHAQAQSYKHVNSRPGSVRRR